MSTDTPLPSPRVARLFSITDDPLDRIDRLMKLREEESRRSSELNDQLVLDRSQFYRRFSQVCTEGVLPAMATVLERLRLKGGGGLIEERPEDLRLHHTHRITLWMSLEGPIDGSPRQDRHPYLQVDADTERRVVILSEGDMWLGAGGSRSGKVAEVTLDEVTPSFIIEQAVAILERAAH